MNAISTNARQSKSRTPGLRRFARASLGIDNNSRQYKEHNSHAADR
jgi:hypothetical protein